MERHDLRPNVVAQALLNMTVNDLLSRSESVPPGFRLTVRLGIGRRTGYVELETVYRLILQGELEVECVIEDNPFTVGLPTLTELGQTIEQLLNAAGQKLDRARKGRASEQLFNQALLERVAIATVYKQILTAFPNLLVGWFQGSGAIASATQLAIITSFSDGEFYHQLLELIDSGEFTSKLEVKEVDRRLLPPIAVCRKNDADYLRPPERPWTDEEAIVGIDLAESDPRYLFYSTLSGYVSLRKTKGFFGGRKYVGYLMKAHSGKILAFIDCATYGNACYVFEG